MIKKTIGSKNKKPKYLIRKRETERNIKKYKSKINYI